MSDVYIEERMTPPHISLSWDLAHHLYIRGPQGRVVIITNKPFSLHASLRKQWVALLRQVQRERSSTLQGGRIIALSDQIMWMQRLLFSHSSPDETYANVYVTTLANYHCAHWDCDALYVTCDLSQETKKQLTENMQQGVLVFYETAS